MADIRVHFPERLAHLATLTAAYLNLLLKAFMRDPNLDPNRVAMFGDDEENFLLYMLNETEIYQHPTIKAEVIC